MKKLIDRRKVLNPDKRIIYTKAEDGMLASVSPGVDTIDEIIANHIPEDATNIKVIKFSELPKDKTFRDAWEVDISDSSNNIQISMPKVREIHMNRIRFIRNYELMKQDLEVKKIMDEEWLNGTPTEPEERKKLDNRKKEIAEHKKALKEIPQTLDLEKYDTPDKIKLVWPLILPKPTTKLYSRVFTFEEESV